MQQTNRLLLGNLHYVPLFSGHWCGRAPGPTVVACVSCLCTAEFHAWQDHCEEIATKHAFCRLQVRAIPKRCNLECHIESGLHEMASRWYTCPEITNVRPYGKSDLKMASDEVGLPTNQEFSKLLLALQSGIPARAFQKQQDFDEWSKSVGDELVKRSYTWQAKAVHCLVEVFLRQPWRNFIQKSDSSPMSFDGRAHYEDIVFQAGRCSDLEVIQGHLGLAEP